MPSVAVRLSTAALLAASAAPAFAQDKSVTIVLPEELDVVEPCWASQSNIGRVLLQNVSETLTYFDPETGTQPRLASEWEDRGNGTWRFTLRDGAKFHDGSDFTAEDVAHSIARTTGEQIVCEIGAKFFGGIDLTTEVVDDHTIDITADPAQPILPLLMSTITIVPAETPMDEFVEKPVGTGPYTFDEYRVGRDITLSRFPDYWGEAPEVETATYVFRDDSAVRAAMVETGEADIAPTIAPQDATNAETDFSYPNSETVFLRIDHHVPPFDDRRVREALNLAVDREAFIGTIMPEGTLLATAIVPPSTTGYNKSLEPYPYDPERAQALLEEARADGVPVDEAITLIGRNQNFANVNEMLEAVRAMFEEAGFNVELQMVDVAEWADLYAQPFAEDRAPQLVTAMHDNANGDPVFSMYFKYASDGLHSAINYPEVDAMIAEATAATGEERAQLWSDLMAKLHDEIIADVILFHMVGFSRVNDRLDFTPSIKTNSELQLSEIGFK